uniref:X-C motif chemokine receptor 1 n=1 Tax=Myripristis murdjan TaxID=586833 RepID=A0A667YCK8_9TELE
ATPTTVPFTYSYSDIYSNYYVSDYEDEVCNKTTVNQFGAMSTLVFFSIVVIFSLFGNILAMVILAKYENLKSLTNTFILNLAVSDLIFTVGLPFWAYYYMYGWTLGEHTCKIVSFVFYIGFYSSGILLIMMTIHRYVAVVSPLSDFVSPNGVYGIMASVIIWAVSFLAAAPALLFMEVQEEKYCYYSSTWKSWGTYLQNVLFIMTCLVVIFCYTQILCRLLRPTAQRRRHRHKTLKLILILVFVFFVSWAPYNIVIFLRSRASQVQETADSSTLSENCKTYSNPLAYAFYISQLFAFSHCCLNPVFYMFAGVKFRNHLKKMLKGWSRKSNSQCTRNSRLTMISVTSGEEFSITTFPQQA